MQKAENEEILRKILHAIGDVPKNVYSPREDTFLMLESIAKISVGGKQVLDIGTGSGILGLFCASRGAHVTVTDVDQSALEYAQKTARVLALSLQTVLSDVFSNVQGKFDLVTFNPPYLPSSTVEDKTVDGGRGGIALSKRFLGGLAEHLNCDGTALLLISTLNDSASLISEANPEFQYEVMAKRQLFFEELQVLSVRFRDNLAR